MKINGVKSKQLGHGYPSLLELIAYGGGILLIVGLIIFGSIKLGIWLWK